MSRCHRSTSTTEVGGLVYAVAPDLEPGLRPICPAGRGSDRCERDIAREPATRFLRGRGKDDRRVCVVSSSPKPKTGRGQSQTNSNRRSVLAAIEAPLGFFVLALLIAEAFLATVLIGASLEKENKMTCVWMGVAMFFVVVALVTLLVWFKPENLVFDKGAILADRGRVPYGTDKKQVPNPSLLTATKSEEGAADVPKS